jgi:hypothetical protein
MGVKQDLNRGFHDFAVTSPALAEAVREIRANLSPEQQEAQIARLGKTFAISTNTRVKPIRAQEQTQAGRKASV